MRIEVVDFDATLPEGVEPLRGPVDRELLSAREADASLRKLVYVDDVPVLYLGISITNTLANTGYVWMVPCKGLKARMAPALREEFEARGAEFFKLYAHTFPGEKAEARWLRFFGFTPYAVTHAGTFYERKMR